MSSLNCKIYETFRLEPSNQSTSLIWDHLGACETCRMAFESDDSPAREALSHLEFGEVVPLLREVLGAGTSRTPRSLLKHPALGPFAAASFPIHLAGYTGQRILGRGGSSEVWLAIQEGTERQVALKITHKTSPGQKERMERECRILASVSHPHLLPIYASGTVGDKVWLALEYCPGGSLSQRVDKTWEPTRAADLVRKVALATQAIHDKGIIHRDIKPGNILIGADGEPRLADFDLARNQDAGQDTTNRTEILGTPAYIAPEQVKSKKVDARADVHALGGVLYHLLTGNAPFQAKSNYEALLLAVHTEPVPPIHFQPMIPRDLDQICRKCLAKDPRDRYATARDLAEDLKRFLEGKPVQARPLGGLQKSLRWAMRNPVGAAVILAAVVALVSITILSALVAIQARDFAEETGKLNEKLTKANGEVTQKESVARTQEDLAKKETIRAKASEDLALSEVYRNRLTQAQNLYEKWDPRAALEQLELCPFEQRGWEHDLLYSRLRENQINLIESGPKITGPNIPLGPVIAGCFFDKLGKKIISVTHDGIISNFDVSRRGFTREIPTGKRDVLQSALSPCGTMVAIANHWGDFAVWDLEKSKEIDSMQLSPQIVQGIVFSNDGNHSLIITNTGFLYCRDLKKKVLQSEKKLSEEGLNAVGFSPDGKTVIVCGQDKGIHCFSYPQLKMVGQVQANHTPGCLAFSPDGRKFATGNRENRESLTLWDAKKLEPIWTGFGHKDNVHTVAWSQDGGLLMTAGADRSVQVWDPANGRNLKTLVGHFDMVDCLAIHPGGMLAVSGDRFGVLKLWTLVPQDNPWFFNRESGNRIVGFAEDPQGKRIICGTTKGELRVFDRESLRLKKVWKVCDEEILALAISPSGKFVAIGTPKSGLIQVDLDSGKSEIISANDANINSIAYGSSDNKLFYFSRKRGKIYCLFFDLKKEQLILNANLDKISRFYFDKIKFMLMFINDNKFEIFDEQQFIFVSSNKIDGLTYGRFALNKLFDQIFFVSYNRIVEYSIARKAFHFYSDDSGLVDGLITISLDDRVLATRGGPWGVTLWNTATRKKLYSFIDHGDEITQMAFLSDGNSLVTTSNDRSIRLYRPEYRSERALIPLADLFQNENTSGEAAVNSTDSPTFFFSKDGNSIAIQYPNQEPEVIETRTFRVKEFRPEDFPPKPRWDSDDHSIVKEGSMFYLINKDIDIKNLKIKNNILNDITSIQLNFRGFFELQNALRKNFESIWLIYHVKYLYEIIKIEFLDHFLSI